MSTSITRKTTASRYFVYAGVSMRPVSAYTTGAESSGGIPMTFDILVQEVDEMHDPLTEETFSVGRIEITRISDLVLRQFKVSRERAIDETAATYQWGTYALEDAETCWDEAFPEHAPGVQSFIHDYIGVEEIFIDPQFRGKGLMGQALKSVAAIIGFGIGSAMVLLAYPWGHLDRDVGNDDDPEYQRDLDKLVLAYWKIGFREMAPVKNVVPMALLADYKNKAWDRLWRRDTCKVIKLRTLKPIT